MVLINIYAIIMINLFLLKKIYIYITFQLMQYFMLK